jgi:hypothetical protein
MLVLFAYTNYVASEFEPRKETIPALLEVKSEIDTSTTPDTKLFTDTIYEACLSTRWSVLLFITC